eukprot:1128943-Pleurochrysis_carterae.AAC.2
MTRVLVPVKLPFPPNLSSTLGTQAVWKQHCGSPTGIECTDRCGLPLCPVASASTPHPSHR